MQIQTSEKEIKRQYQARWLAKPEKLEIARESCRKWRRKHLENVRTTDRERSRARRKDPEYRAKQTAYLREWRRANKDKTRAAKLKRRQAIGEDQIASSELEMHLNSIGRKCVYCYGPYEHLDHVIPLSKGGRHLLKNLLPSCERCNESKQDKHWLEWFISRNYFDSDRAIFILSIINR